MHEFKLNGKPYRMASKWSDLTPKQVISLVPLYYSERTPKLRVNAVLQLSNVPEKLLRRMDGEDIYMLSELACELFDQPIEHPELLDFEWRQTRYLMPRNDFDNVVAIEYALADTYFRNFSKSGDPLQLDLMVATLCRPRKAGRYELDPEWDGDPREKYNSRIAQARALDIANLPFEHKALVLQQFLAAKKKIHTTYSAVFVTPDDAGGSPAGGGPNFGMLGVIYDLAEQQVFGDFQRTAFTGVHIVFTYLLKKHFDKQEN